MPYAPTNNHPHWPQGPQDTPPTIINLGDHPSLSEPSHTPASAALVEPANLPLPLNYTYRGRHEDDSPSGDDPYYALDSSASHDRSKKRKLRPEVYFSTDFGPAFVRGSWKNGSFSPQKPTTHAPLIPRLPTTSSLQSNALIPPAPLLVSRPSNEQNRSSSGPVTISLTSSLPNPISTKFSRDSLRQVKGEEASAVAFSEYEEVSSGSSSESEDYGELSLIRGMQGISLGSQKPLEGSGLRPSNDSQWRFHGKSSSFKLISAARKFQQLHMDEIAKSQPDGSGSGSPRASGSSGSCDIRFCPLDFHLSQWETDAGDSVPQFSGNLKTHWPDMDLAEQLIDMYFAVMNAVFPLLHRPTFQRQWQDRLFERDVWFACLCMSLFAVASRWCHDPRVLFRDANDTSTPPEKSDPIWNSAGWKYVQVAIELQNSAFSVILPPSLFEVQTYHNIGLFLRGTSVYTDAWTFVSIGLRKAQDIGAHRRSVYGPVPTVEGELWKRAYWQLASFDAITSMILGRPCASRDEDFDLDMPLEVDDEYWENEDPALAFKQPPGKPSRVSAFICWIKLTRIAAHALRTLYALEKSKLPLGLVGPRWREETVQRLNDAMGDWSNEMPEHLRWNTNIKDPILATQSSTINTTYYMVQIVAHRPFIPLPTAHPSGEFYRRSQPGIRPDFQWNSLAVCTNAAKGIVEIVEGYAQNYTQQNFASMANCCYIGAGVLLVHLWVLKAMERSGDVPEGGKAASEERMKDVTTTLKKLMERLEAIAPKMEVAAMWLGEIMESLPSYDIQLEPSAEEEQQPLAAKEESPTSDSPVPIVPSQAYQYIDVPESSQPDRGSLTVQTEPVTARVDYPTHPPEAGSAYPSQTPVRHPPAHTTPSTPQLYSSLSSATASASPYTPVHRWDPPVLDRRTRQIHEHSASVPVASSSTHGAYTPPVTRGHMLSLRHQSSFPSFSPEELSMAHFDPGLPPGQKDVSVPLPPWVVFQGATTGAVQSFFENPGQGSTLSYVRVKPEEDTMPILSDYQPNAIQTPAILPPFYPAPSNNMRQQQVYSQASHVAATAAPNYGQPWEYATYRPDWGSKPSRVVPQYLPSAHSRRSSSSFHQGSNEQLRNVGYETLYTSDGRPHQPQHQHSPPQHQHHLQHQQ
ncbi:hypothetical protein EIP91_006114 [Steccherinum ochraceum]|uniref:Xylanolytic transcriptional activator regulatory domain-containing protein n=1 Tax=Steccherinum ochraceum TaxID=92696 RepID=A0A4R0RMH9_9APHY|nr:hypothetical protein EIP91_006114 [Steccherinum ochraceum]